MALIVQKYGGSSVATIEKIKLVAQRVARSAKDNQVIVVVSAMGKTTNQLIDLAGEITATPPSREYDLLLSTGEKVSAALLSIALNSIGVEAIALSAWHLGIVTDSNHRFARVKTIDPNPIRKELESGKVVVAAGFQGISEEHQITTLGRGATDKTAVMLAVALKADQCEINTDVDGVYTSDPRHFPHARKLKSISYEELLELATSGAQVMNSDAVELAKKYDMNLEVRHSFKNVEGTMVQSFSGVDDPVVVGAACTPDEARISLHQVQTRGGGLDRLFRKVSDANINVDMILLTPSQQGSEISFTVPEEHLSKATEVVEALKSDLGITSFSTDDQVAKVSIVGVGMQNHKGVAARMFETLSRQKIMPIAVTTSEIKVSVLVEQSQAQEALKAVHEEFDLSSKDSAAILG